MERPDRDDLRCGRGEARTDAREREDEESLRQIRR